MEFHAAVRATYPALAERFVFVTGGAFSNDARRFMEETVSAIIQKPFRVEDLLSLIERVAAGGGRRPAGPRPSDGARALMAAARPRKLVVAALIRDGGAC